MKQTRKWTIFALLKIGESVGVFFLILGITNLGSIPVILGLDFRRILGLPGSTTVAENFLIGISMLCFFTFVLMAGGLILYIIFKYPIKAIIKKNIEWADSIEKKISRRKK